MRFVPSALAGIGLLLVAGAASAQQLHIMREQVLRPATAEDRPLVDKVREDLARVRVAEEAYFAANQTYAAEVSDLKGLKLASGATVVILMSGPAGWKAEATHPSLTGAEVVHVMRTKDGETGCPMMGQGGMGGAGGMKGMGGMGGMMGGGKPGDCCAAQGAPKTPAPEHQH
jgi:hypothetical protein